MRNVTRNNIPPSLNRNHSRWKNDLLAEIKKAKREKRKPEEKYFNYYNKSDIKESLASMYNNNCCYCECYIKDVSHPHIEHRKPKKKYPDYCYDWDNLHLGCEVCNGNKSDQFNVTHPILDSVSDTISNHLTYYEGSGQGIYVKPIANSERAKCTIDHANLNRKELRVNARLPIYLETIKLIREMLPHRGTPEYDFMLEVLEDKYEEPHGSLIQFLVEEFL